MGTPESLQKVLQAGDQAPGCDPGETVHAGPFGGTLSDHGLLYAVAYLDPSGDQARWIGPPDDLQLVYRDGMQAPGCEPGAVFWVADYVVFNDAGQIAFRGIVTSPNDVGRWLGGPGELALVCRDGDPVPDLGPGVTWKNAGTHGSATNVWGHSPESGFVQGPGITTANDYVFYIWSAGNLQLIAHEGDPVPEAGPGVTVATANCCLINNRGEAFYQVVYAGPGITSSNRVAMYFGPIGQGVQTLRDSDPSPTFAPGISLCGVGAVPGHTAMNDTGEIITATRIEGLGVTDETDVVLWLWHRVLRRWAPVFRSGDSVGDRTPYIEDEYDAGNLFWGATSGSDGEFQSLNDAGTLALRFEFIDGTVGVYLMRPPVFGDADEDGDLDIADWSQMTGCWTGPGEPVAPDCAVFDLDIDGDVDLADQQMVQVLFTTN